MLRVPLNKAHLKRTFGVLYGWTQMTPKSMFLSEDHDAAAKPIYPGMVAKKLVGEVVDVANATDTNVIGFFGLYAGGDGINELEEVGVNAMAVWVLGPDAEAYVDAPAFDTEADFTESTGAAPTLLYSGADGKITDTGTVPVARLLKVESANRIIIGGLHAGDAGPA